MEDAAEYGPERLGIALVFLGEGDDIPVAGSQLPARHPPTSDLQNADGRHAGREYGLQVTPAEGRGEGQICGRRVFYRLCLASYPPLCPLAVAPWVAAVRTRGTGTHPVAAGGRAWP